ncbi:cytidine deaminase [Patiriisocius marinistellae]|uniref:Cytidine deaminase n=1 Tax=Patiriisocius marinistellae TaxID=2494560 RepID=A0A5J4FWL9_9FLAO|nr:cytidine deaminase [Patiriisocius marinistellae]GEQ85582.1 cytidine deaminase [Patiriisocius marinistellae]
MKKHIIETVLEVYDSITELPKDIQQLMNKAQEARDRAYAPYSSFMVGAALQLANGEVVLGNNQENAAYPSGLCAERVAVFYAGATYPGVAVNNVALTVKSLKHIVETPTPPCGACRQSLAEYEVNQKSPMTVYFMGEKGKVVKANSIKDLLPLVFDSSFLK